MISRRRFFAIAGITLCGSAGAQQPQDIQERRRAAFEEAIRKVTGGAPAKQGKVKLDIPPLIDNGNAVPVSVTVESPMTAAEHVKSVHVLTEKNPQPYVISAFLGPRAGRALVSVRARIADTGDVIAIAQLSDGSFWSDTARVVVTLSACLEDMPI